MLPCSLFASTQLNPRLPPLWSAMAMSRTEDELQIRIETLDSPAVFKKSLDTHIAEVKAEQVVRDEPKRKWQSYVWDTFDKSPEERKFLFKLDTASAHIRLPRLLHQVPRPSQPQQRIRFRHERGPRPDQNQLNYMQTLWAVGYVIGEVPSNILLTRVRPSIWIPTMEVIWSVLTMCLSRCNKVEQMYALRFLIGLAESTFYPGYAVHNRIVVPTGRAGQAILHLPH